MATDELSPSSLLPEDEEPTLGKFDNTAMDPGQWTDINPIDAFNYVPETLRGTQYEGEMDDVMRSLFQRGEAGFDRAVDLDAGNLEWALRVFKGVSPEVAAKAQKLSKEYGFNLPTVFRNMQDYQEWGEARDLIISLGEKRKTGELKYPVTAAWLGDPINMAQARDDYVALQELEGIIATHTSSWPKLIATKGLGDGLKEAVRSRAGTALAIWELYAVQGKELERVYDKLMSGENLTFREHARMAMGNQVPHIVQLSRLLPDSTVENTTDLLNAIIDSETLRSAILPPDPDIASKVENWTVGASQMAIQSGEQLLGRAALGPYGGMALIFSRIFGSDYIQARKQGVDIERAVIGSAGDALIQSAMEALATEFTYQAGMSSLSDPGTTAAVNWLSSMGMEWGTEWAQAFPGDAAMAWMMMEVEGKTPQETWEAFKNNISETSWQGFIEGSYTVPMSLLGLGGSLTYSYAHSRSLKSNHAKWTKIMDRLKGSKLNARSPETSAEHLDALVSEYDEDPNIYVPRERLEQAARDTGNSMDDVVFKLGLEEEMARTEEVMGEEVAIEKATFYANYAGTDLALALHNDVRWDGPQSSTINEVSDRIEDTQKKIDEMTRRYEDVFKDTKAPVTIKEMRDILMRPKDQDGMAMPREDADLYLTIFMAGAKVLSKEEGRTTEQWFDDDHNFILEVGGIPVSVPAELVGKRILFSEDARARATDELQNIEHWVDLIEQEGAPIAADEARRVYHITTEEGAAGIAREGLHGSDEDRVFVSVDRDTSDAMMVSIRRMNTFETINEVDQWFLDQGFSPTEIAKLEDEMPSDWRDDPQKRYIDLTELFRGTERQQELIHYDMASKFIGKDPVQLTGIYRGEIPPDYSFEGPFSPEAGMPLLRDTFVQDIQRTPLPPPPTPRWGWGIPEHGIEMDEDEHPNGFATEEEAYEDMLLNYMLELHPNDVTNKHMVKLAERNKMQRVYDQYQAGEMDIEELFDALEDITDDSAVGAWRTQYENAYREFYDEWGGREGSLDYDIEKIEHQIEQHLASPIIDYGDYDLSQAGTFYQLAPKYMETVGKLAEEPGPLQQLYITALDMQSKMDQDPSLLKLNPDLPWLEDNEEYWGSIDPDILCQKSIGVDIGLRIMKDILGDRYDNNMAWDLINRCNEYGLATPCPQCYVYSNRSVEGGNSAKRVVLGVGGYNGQVLRQDKDTILVWKGRGLRHYSSTDFKAEHIPGLIMEVIDLAAKGIPMTAYSKVADFARMFGPAGAYINMSIGRNDQIGMNKRLAFEMRERFPNVATVYVAFTDAEVIEALRDDRIDHIIPWHSSMQPMKELQKKLKDPDMVDYQNDRDCYQSEQEYYTKRIRRKNKKTGKYKVKLYKKSRRTAPAKKKIKDKDHNGSYERYMELIEKRKLIPKFDRIRKILEEAGETDLYMKLIGPEYGKYQGGGQWQFPYSAPDPTAIDTSIANAVLARRRQFLKRSEQRHYNRIARQIAREVDKGVWEPVEEVVVKRGAVRKQTDRLQQSALTLYQGGPLWVSKVREIVTGRNVPNKVDITDLTRWMAKLGVTKDEMKWLDLPSLYNDRDGKVSAEALVDYVNANALIVEERWWGDSRLSQFQFNNEDDYDVAIAYATEKAAEYTKRIEKARAKGNHVKADMLQAQSEAVGEKALELEHEKERFILATVNPIAEPVSTATDFEWDGGEQLEDGTYVWRGLDPASNTTPVTIQYDQDSGEWSAEHDNYGFIHIFYREEGDGGNLQTAADRLSVILNHPQDYLHTNIDPENVDRPKHADYQLKGRKTGYFEVALKMPRGLTDDFPGSAYHLGGEPNVLVWVRGNIRTLADGRKMLFIEEIQSDWHQKGYAFGYQDRQEIKRIQEEYDIYTKASNWVATVFPEALDSDLTIADLVKRGETAARLEEFSELVRDKTWQQIESLRIARSKELMDRHVFNPAKKIPDAPFKESWPYLAMKRMIRYAADMDMDMVGWTTAEQQVQRWKSLLRKHMDKLEWVKTPGGIHLKGYKQIKAGPSPDLDWLEYDELVDLATSTGQFTFEELDIGEDNQPSREDLIELIDQEINLADVTIYLDEWRLRNPDRVLAIAENTEPEYEKVFDTEEDEDLHPYDPDIIPSVVGKGMGKRIIDSPVQSGSFEGEDITVDDVWPTMVYDKKLVGWADAFSKQYGSTGVETVDLRPQLPREEQDDELALLPANVPSATFMEIEGFFEEDAGYYSFNHAEHLFISLNPGPYEGWQPGMPTSYRVIDDRRAPGDQILFITPDLNEAVRYAYENEGLEPPTDDVPTRTSRIEFEKDLSAYAGQGLPAWDERAHAFPMTQELKEAAWSGLIQFQKTVPESEARGAVTFADDFTKIELFRTADKSTFLHEMSHILFRDMQRLVQAGVASESLQADYQTLVEFVADVGGINTVEGQEKLAGAFETYLREGRAPSVNLIPAFRRFKKWLSDIYKSVRTRVEINDEIRGVFDRMLASEQEIEEVTKYYESYQDLMELLDLTEAEKTELRGKKREAREKSLEERLAQHMRAYLAAEGGMAKVRQDASAIVADQPVYKAIDLIRAFNGISADDITPIYGEDVAEALRRKQLIRRAGEAPLAEIAAEVGFETEEELLNTILESPSKTEAIDTTATDIRNKIEARIKEGLSSDEGVPGEEAYHNDGNLEYLIAQANILQKRIEAAEGRKLRRLEMQVYKDAAQAALMKRKASDATRYDRFAAAELRYFRAFRKAMERGDHRAALEAKELQILHHAMVQAAVKARDQKIAISKFYAPSRFKKLLDRTESVYRELAKDIAFFYRLSKIEPIESGDQLSMKNVSEAVEAIIPDWIQKKVLPHDFNNWRDLTMGQLLELDETVRSVLGFGTEEFKAFMDSQLRTPAEVIAASTELMAKLKSKTGRDRSKFTDRFLDSVDGLLAMTTQTEMIFEMLDNYSYTENNEFGPLRKMFMTLVAQEVQYVDMKTRVIEEAQPHWNVLHGLKDRLGDFFNVPNVEMPQVLKDTRRHTWDANMLIAAALNMGNERNRNALKNGYGWTDTDLDNIAKMLSAREWRAIQGIWDTTNTLFEPLDEVTFRMYNKHLVEESALPMIIKTNNETVVELEGGYYPLMFDHAVSEKADEIREEDILKNRISNIHRTTKTRDGATFARVDGHSLPPLLNVSVWVQHMADVSRTITHSEIVRDFNRVMSDREWRSMVRKKAGDKTLKYLQNWLAFQARPEFEMDSSVAGKVIEANRRLMTIMMLGGKIGTGLRQRTSLVNAASALDPENPANGYMWIARGVGSVDGSNSVFGLKSSEVWQKIIAKSGFMRARASNIDNELNNIRGTFDPLVKDFEVLGKKFTRRDIQDAFFEFILMNDRAAVGPIWMGAYSKKMSELSTDVEMTREMKDEAAIEYADMIVRTTQPSALPFDLNEFQRSGSGAGIHRLFASFMTYQFKFGSRAVTQTRAYRANKMSTRDYMKYLFNDHMIGPWANLTVRSLLITGTLPLWWELLWAPLESIVSWIPYLRDVPRALKMGTYAGGLGRVPAFEPANRIIKGARAPYLWAFKEKEFSSMVWDIMRATEAGTGIAPLNAVQEIMTLYKNIKEREEE